MNIHARRTDEWPPRLLRLVAGRAVRREVGHLDRIALIHRLYRSHGDDALRGSGDAERHFLIGMVQERCGRALAAFDPGVDLAAFRRLPTTHLERPVSESRSSCLTAQLNHQQAISVVDVAPSEG